MGLPKAVQEMQDAAEKIQSGIQQNDEGKTEAKKDGQEPASNPKQQQPSDTGTVPKAEYDALDQRYRAYKKMYDKEVHGFRTTLADKDAEIDKLTGEVEALKKSLDEAAKSGKEQDHGDVDLDAIKREFGDEFIDAVGDLSRTQLMRENAALIARIEKLEKSFSEKQPKPSNDGGRETSKSNQDFFTRLSDLVPNWTKVNGTQGFSDFLDLPDEDGNRRQDNLSAAQRSGNAIEVARHFLDYADYQARHRDGASGDYLPDGSAGGGSVDEFGFTDDDIIYEDELEEYYKLAALRKFSDEEIKKYEAKISNAMANDLIRRRPRR